MRALVLVALGGCGRIAFDPLADAAAPLGLAGNVVQMQASATTSATFTISPLAQGDVLLLHTGCDGSVTPTAVTVSAPGWTFAQLGTIDGASLKWAALFGATVPDTAPVTVTITWGINCFFINALGDEFANADPTSPFEAYDVTYGTTDCMGAVTTLSAGDTIWAACNSGGTVTDVGPGYSKAGDDGKDDWSEYKLTSDPAGTVEQAVILTKSGGQFVMTTVAIKPR